MTAFAAFVDGGPARLQRLPCIHATDGHSFRTILESKCLTPAMCPVYKEDLLYLSYGRPSYRVGAISEASRIRARLPVCFLLSPNAIDKCKRIMPFDSGAFASGRLIQHFSPRASLADFEMTPHIDSAQRLVSRCFDANSDYFWGRGLSHVDYPAMQFEADGYHSLVTAAVEAEHDDRASAIEVQLDGAILLNDQVVDAVILPETFLKDPSVRRVVEDEWNAVALEYQYTRMKPLEYTSKLYDLAEARLRTLSLL